MPVRKPRLPRISPTTNKVEYEVLNRLNLDLNQAATQLNPNEVRYFCNRYYQMQDQRKRATNQLYAADQALAPNRLLLFDLEMSRRQESNIKSAMLSYAKSHLAGRWMLSQYGIGPVIASAMLAYIDIKKAPYAGHIWSFAGFNPQVKWLSREQANAWVREQGQVTEDTVYKAAAFFHRRADTILRDATTDLKTGDTRPLTATTLSAALARCPWNAKFKVVCWKASDCFKKFHNRNKHDNFYGDLYEKYRVMALEKNASGGFASLAEKTLAERNFSHGPTRTIYESGQLPPGRIDLWAMRATVKIFLAHIHHVLYEIEFNQPPPTPYILAKDESHTHYYPPPHWPLVEVENGNYKVADEPEDE